MPHIGREDVLRFGLLGAATGALIWLLDVLTTTGVALGVATAVLLLCVLGAATRLRRTIRADLEAVATINWLNHTLATRQPIAVPSGWSASDRLLVHLVRLVREKRPRRILELGGGSSTVVLAYLLAEGDAARALVSVDHHEGYADATRQALSAHGFPSVEVRVAPLTERGGTPWYDAHAFEDLADVEFLVVDGPPGMVAPMARAPALPMLRSRLATGALIVVDDANRGDEAAMVEDWLASGHVELVLRDTAGKGVTVLRTVGPRTAPPHGAA